MQDQSPSSNNPANPLLKSAALTLSKDSLAPAKKNSYVITARLTFKRSNDLRGVALTRNGDEITVCFSLSVKRASFQLSFSADNPKLKTAKHLRLQKIAHHSSLSTTIDIKSYVESRNRFDLAANSRISTIRVGGKITKSDKTVEKSTITVPSANITVTISPTEIHWEMEPYKYHLGNSKKSYLEGDVFVHGDRNNQQFLPACEIRWDSEKADSSLVVRGSVFSSMDDLQVEQIRFLDNLGRAISLTRLAQPTNSRWSKEKIIPFSTASAKQRIVKQIIRKHLESQGMQMQGARVEICNAHT